MPLLAVFSHDSRVLDALRRPSAQEHDVATARSWERLLWLIRERPVTGVVLDSDAVAGEREPDGAVADLWRWFPSLSTVLVHRPDIDPITLFRLGRVGPEGLALFRLAGPPVGLWDALARASRMGTEAYVARALGPRIASREATVIRLALNGVQLGWSAHDLAERVCLTRAHLSVRLRRTGLPSTGHLLIWAKLLHAARWLGDPARSAESISRQLEYSSGAAFRRALHNYVGGTPTEVRDRGGFHAVLPAFLDACGLDASLGGGRSVA